MDRQHQRKDSEEGITSLEEDANEPKNKASDWMEIAGVMDWVEAAIDTDGPTPEKAFVSAAEPTAVEPTATIDDAQLEMLIKKALIYVVDDELVMRILMDRALENAGFENIKLFADGDDVIKAIFDEDGRIREMPALIMSDTEMKRMGGLALYEKIKTINESARPLFLASSGNHNTQAKWGSVPFISKPFDIFEVTKMVAEELKRNGRFTKN